MVIDVSVVRPCMRQLNSDQSRIKELERSVASVAVGSGLRSQVHRKKSRQRNITCCRIGYKIGCMGDWFMINKISGTIYFDAAIATTNTKTFQMNSYQKHCIFAVLIVPCM